MPRIVFVLGLIGGAVGAQAAVVYDNSTTYTGNIHVLMPAGMSESTEHGNELTLAGSDRVATNVVVWMRVMGGGACTFTLEVRFRRNDGPDGRPGSLIWTSGPRPSIIDSGFNLAYSIPVPNVVVPDGFTCTIQTTNRMSGNMSQMGPALYNPPTTGAAPFGSWQQTGPGPEDWQFASVAEPPFGIRVTAIPCSNPRNGDLDGDGAANGDDVQRFAAAAAVNSTAVSDVCAADFSGNAMIDAEDAPGMVERMLSP